MAARRVVLRRNPAVVCYWEDGQFLFHDFVANRVVPADPATCRILDFFGDWRPSRDFLGIVSPKERAEAERLLAHLLRLRLLQRSDVPLAPGDRSIERWGDWNPAAGFFHCSTKNVHYDPDPARAERRLARKSAAVPMPPVVKRYNGARKVRLPAGRSPGDLSETLQNRRTWRTFSSRPLPLEDLSTLLRLTWGVSHRVAVPGQGTLFLKTAPSGGGRHSIEAYVLALRVAGLPRGIYHYAADRHLLELVKPGAPRNAVTRYIPTQWWFQKAAALILMTSVFERMQWRYDYPRAYRAVLAESGHHCQTFYLLATAMGLAPFSTMSLADSIIERDLGIDGVSESVIYVAGVGVRPTGGDPVSALPGHPFSKSKATRRG
jgi:SagB-type dehydrogenase family enzyme